MFSAFIEKPRLIYRDKFGCKRLFLSKILQI
ncbi:hypothetical protein MHA_2408 [Mannheimia haemolytica PHL213]|nr:hypothetical protein MHA_2408 [Mannheimia haemolytica PHL213]